MRLSASAIQVLAFTCIVGACSAPAAAPAPDLAAERAAVRTADSSWEAAAVSRNTDAGVAAFAPEGAMYPPQQAAVVGHDALRKYISGAFAMPAFSVTWKTDSVVVANSGDLAYAMGSSRYTFPGQKAGAVDTSYGKGISIWRKDSASGHWMVVADIWNDAPAPGAAQAAPASAK